MFFIETYDCMIILISIDITTPAVLRFLGSFVFWGEADTQKTFTQSFIIFFRPFVWWSLSSWWWFRRVSTTCCCLLCRGDGTCEEGKNIINFCKMKNEEKQRVSEQLKGGKVRFWSERTSIVGNGQRPMVAVWLQLWGRKALRGKHYFSFFAQFYGTGLRNEQNEPRFSNRFKKLRAGIFLQKADD